MGIFSKKKSAVNNPQCAVVIVAAGSSERMGFDKIMYKIGDIPVIIRTALAFNRSELVSEIVIVAASSKLEEIADLCSKFDLKKVRTIVCGGSNRAESALAGVSAVSEGAKLIAIHDGARPLVTEELIARTVFAAAEYRAAVPAVKCTDTLKKISEDGFTVQNVCRDDVVSIQTPQIFDADIIKGALTAVVTKNIAVTDDSSAVELMGLKSRIVEGDKENIKLTTVADIKIAEFLFSIRGN